MGIQALHLLTKYWKHLVIVSGSIGYHGSPSKGKLGSPTIFNVVVYAVINHWVMEVSKEEVGIDGFWSAAGKMAAFFYWGNDLLASTRSESI